MTGRDRGSATVGVLALVPVLLLSVGTAMALVQLAAARHRAATAADFAALAAAGALQDPAALVAADPGATACARADAVARLNHASVMSCVVDGDDVRVTTEVPPPTLVARAAALAGAAAEPIRAAARAGPAAGPSDEAVP